MKSLKFFQKQAATIRSRILKTAHRARTPHIGSALSTVDILTHLYFHTLRLKSDQPEWPDRDRFILSKGHGGLALYATLVQRSFFSEKKLSYYGSDQSPLAGHPILNSAPGIEATSGSLGHGLNIGLGQALAAKHDSRPYRVFVMLSDGECNEGSVWEAAMAASQWRLDNLIAIIDYNKIQSFGTTKEVMDLEPLADKWRAFGWSVKEANGHDFKDLLAAFRKIPLHASKPTVVIAHTIKGRGVSFMENTVDWHYKNLNDDLLKKALAEIREA